MNCKECEKRRCPSCGSAENCNACLYVGGDYMEVRDWLSDINIPAAGEPFDCVEVRFKNGRKDFYRNTNKLPLAVGDIVAVESSPGHDIGCVMLTGELVRVQMRRKKQDPASGEIRKVYRVATQKDIDIWQTAISREQKTLVRTREICDNLGLVMKLSDVEYQGDNLKATFYYTAEGRVDFRQLIKELAGAFGVRIEMRQIGLRQEAARVGSIGSCGRELCCTTWLSDFRSVNTSAARTQRLSLNPQKLAGQCGKLKCCLNFELDVYVDALKGFPQSDAPLRTEKGSAYFQKMDVFKGMYWYAYDFEIMNWIGLPVSAVAEIQRLNRKGEKPESLEMYVEQEDDRPKERRAESTELKAVEEGELTRFDKRSSGRGGRDSNRRRENNRDNNRGREDRRRDDRQRDERNNRSAGEGEKREADGNNGSAEREGRRENGRGRDNNRRRDRRRDDRPREERQREDRDGRAGGENREGEQNSGESGSRSDNRRRENNRDNGRGRDDRRRDGRSREDRLREDRGDRSGDENREGAQNAGENGGRSDNRRRENNRDNIRGRDDRRRGDRSREGRPCEDRGDRSGGEIREGAQNAGENGGRSDSRSQGERKDGADHE